MQYDRESWWREWRQTALPVAVTLGLLALGLANVVSRATSSEVEDGVLWVERAVGVVAAEIAAPSAASRAGMIDEGSKVHDAYAMTKNPSAVIVSPDGRIDSSGVVGIPAIRDLVAQRLG